MLNKAVGEVLEELRTENGLSQEQLAKVANLHSIHISRLECEVSGITIRANFNICQTLNVVPNNFIKLVEKRLVETKWFSIGFN